MNAGTDLMYNRVRSSGTDIEQDRPSHLIANDFEVMKEKTCDVTSMRTPNREDSAECVYNFGLVRDSKPSLANLRVWAS